jgi:epsilon-lactone hydrolase
MAVTSVAVRVRRALTGQSTSELLAELRTREYPEPAPMPRSMRTRYDVVEDEVDGCPVLRLTPKARAGAQQLLYTHGGSYVHPIAAEQWWFLDRMTRGSDVRITLPLYRLAPEGTVGPAYDLLRRVYLELVESGPVTLAGDSAGGGLALGQAIAYRDAGLPAPRQVVLIAPWVDLTLSNPAVPSLEPVDPVLRADTIRACGALWAGDRDPNAPDAQSTVRRPRRASAGAHLPGWIRHPRGRRAGAGQPAAAVGQHRHVHLRSHRHPRLLGAFWTREARRALHTVNQLLRE